MPNKATTALEPSAAMQATQALPSSLDGLKTASTPLTKAMSLGVDSPERFRMGELGYLGLSVFNGVTNDELRRELNFPQSVQTFKEMNYHGSINSAITLFDSIIAKATWKVVPPEDATEEEKARAKIIDSMREDIEGGWGEFIRDVLSMNIFGFAVHEKVYRRRYTSNGSTYNDGVIGWKKLPIRAQETIDKFVFSDDGNEILGVRQNISNITANYNSVSSGKQISNITLPRSKFLLFRAGKHRGDPYGKSPLRDAYIAWRYLTSLEELEATGVNKDLTGLPILYLPSQYLSADASPAQKEIRVYYENAMRNLQMNQQSAMILPNAFDPESRQPMFRLELLSVDGKKNFDISKIKEYYKNLIVTSLFSDILSMGQSQVGSFALGSIKNSLSGAAAEGMLNGIVEVLNRDLIKQTYELNGWDYSRACKLDFDNLESDDLDSYSKYMQRVASVGLLEKDRAVLNKVRVMAGIDALPENLEPQQELITPDTSRSGDSFNTATGGLNGTSDSVADTDTSANNSDNAA